jgi:hypothetical protein
MWKNPLAIETVHYTWVNVALTPYKALSRHERENMHQQTTRTYTIAVLIHNNKEYYLLLQIYDNIDLFSKKTFTTHLIQNIYSKM